MTDLPLFDDWQLSPDGNELGGRARVLPVRTVDNRRAVFKVAEPVGWHVGQVPALKVWAGQGAVEVLRAKPSLGALLLEPLDDTWLDDDELAGAVAQLWRRLHVPAPAQVPRLDELVRRELTDLRAAGRSVPLPPRMLQQASTAAERLLREAPEPVLLHGALHRPHVLLRRGVPVAVAPLGLAGDPHGETAGWLLDATGPTTQVQDHFWRLLDALAAAGLDVDERRARDWTVVLITVWAAAATQRREQTRLLGLVKAISAVQVDQDW